MPNRETPESPGASRSFASPIDLPLIIGAAVAAVEFLPTGVALAVLLIFAGWAQRWERLIDSQGRQVPHRTILLGWTVIATTAILLPANISAHSSWGPWAWWLVPSAIGMALATESVAAWSDPPVLRLAEVGIGLFGVGLGGWLIATRGLGKHRVCRPPQHRLRMCGALSFGCMTFTLFAFSLGQWTLGLATGCLAIALLTCSGHDAHPVRRCLSCGLVVAGTALAGLVHLQLGSIVIAVSMWFLSLALVHCFASLAWRQDRVNVAVRRTIRWLRSAQYGDRS